MNRNKKFKIFIAICLFTSNMQGMLKSIFGTSSFAKAFSFAKTSKNRSEDAKRKKKRVPLISIVIQKNNYETINIPIKKIKTIPDDILLHIMEYTKFNPDMMKLKLVNKNFLDVFNKTFTDPNEESNRSFYIPIREQTFENKEEFNHMIKFIKKLKASKERTKRKITVDLQGYTTKFDLSKESIDFIIAELTKYREIEKTKSTCFDEFIQNPCIIFNEIGSCFQELPEYIEYCCACNKKKMHLSKEKRKTACLACTGITALASIFGGLITFSAIAIALR
ncbi:hypothetical protein ACFLYA_02060 [Candidatus Dependentiae bacterium]